MLILRTLNVAFELEVTWNYTLFVDRIVSSFGPEISHALYSLLGLES